MATGDAMSEKTEKATPHKLQKAKEKGQVSKSVELNTCVALLVMLALITALWPKQLKEIQDLMRHLLSFAAHVQFTLDNINHIHQFILSKLVSLWLPFTIATLLALVLTSIAQTGLVWSATPLIPDFKRFDIIQGCKKIFSLKTSFEAIKSILKLSAAFILLYFSLNNQLPHILKLMLSQPSQVPAFMMHFLLTIIFQLALLLLFLAGIDKFYTRWKFGKDQRMSKQDIKDEHKQKEGDPKIKQKIKQLQFQLRQKTASLKQVKTADVIITNPTHLAIALKYERGTMPSPKVVCKAQDEMVTQVKELARKHGVPLIEHKLFARLLYQTTELNQYINKDLFPQAAEIFRNLYQQRKNQVE
jgi:flagellar biosynthetic protein FlhB